MHENVKKFWELENLDDILILKDEKTECEKHFCEIKDKLTGKYIVLLPIKEETELGNSYTVEKVRLENLSKRWNKMIE